MREKKKLTLILFDHLQQTWNPGNTSSRGYSAASCNPSSQEAEGEPELEAAPTLTTISLCPRSRGTYITQNITQVILN